MTNQTEHFVAPDTQTSSELDHRSHPIGKPKQPRLKETQYRQFFPVQLDAQGPTYDPDGG